MADCEIRENGCIINANSVTRENGLILWRPAFRRVYTLTSSRHWVEQRFVSASNGQLKLMGLRVTKSYVAVPFATLAYLAARLHA